MSAIILFMAGIAAIAGWWLSQQRLGAKPWLEEGVIADLREESPSSLPPAKIGLGVFLAVVGSLFALFISAYSMRMNMVDWRALPVPRLLWFNTGVLISSSIALQWAHVAARRNDMDGVIIGLCAGGASAVTFLIGQLLAWQQLSARGVFRSVQSSQFLLLPDHRGARAASDGRSGGPRQNDCQGVARR